LFKNDEKFEECSFTKFVFAKPSDKANEKTEQNGRK